MAHSLLHLGLGCTAGLAVATPALLAHWRTRTTPMARHALRWILIPWACGIFAIIPSILQNLGVPSAFTDGWWMNIFFLHPLLTHTKQGGMLWGEFLVFSILFLEYSVLLLLLRSAQEKSKHRTTE